jgi:hypothetical protein
MLALPCLPVKESFGGMTLPPNITDEVVWKYVLDCSMPGLGSFGLGLSDHSATYRAHVAPYNSEIGRVFVNWDRGLFQNHIVNTAPSGA